jgi:hypothetical protein
MVAVCCRGDHFLATFAGVRFFAPDFEVVPNWSEIPVRQTMQSRRRLIWRSSFTAGAEFRPEIVMGPRIGSPPSPPDYLYWRSLRQGRPGGSEKRGLMPDGAAMRCSSFLKATDTSKHIGVVSGGRRKGVATRYGDSSCYSNSAASEHSFECARVLQGFSADERIILCRGMVVTSANVPSVGSA